MAAVHKLSMRTVTLTVRLPRALPLRLWVGAQFIKMAAIIIGCGVKIEHEPSNLSEPPEPAHDAQVTLSK